jgi:GNAT superfamily N-acetyltransferase
MVGILQRWFNYPPKPKTPFITDKGGKKFSIVWVRDEDFLQMLVSYSGHLVGRVNLLLEKQNEAIIVDLRIFCFRPEDLSLRNRGLGKAMLHEAIAMAKQHKVILLKGLISPDEYTTIKYLVEWYQRQGFEVTRKDGSYIIRMKLE